MHLGYTAENEALHRYHVAQNLPPHLHNRRCQMKELVCHIPESGNLRVGWIDPLSDGVYHHS